MRFISHALSLVKNDRIPKNPEKIKALLRKMEEEERIYQETQKNIQRIRDLREKKRERTIKPQGHSIYRRCRSCNDLFLKSERHRCYE